MTGAPITNWTSVACSSDGTRLVAASSYGGIYVARVVPPLTINSIFKSTMLSWTASTGEFVLQYNNNLGTTNWQPVTNTLNFISSTQQNVVTIPTPASNVFYRLVTP